MLVSAQGMAEEKALGPTAGCIRVIPESFELGAWHVVPGGGLRDPGKVSTKRASTLHGRPFNSTTEGALKHWLVNKSHLLFSLPTLS